MLGGRPYRYLSAAVKSNRPVGIAVMALLFKCLQYTPRRMAKPRHSGATGGWYQSYGGPRQCPVDIAAKREDRPLRTRRREGRCGCREWWRATEVPVLVGVCTAHVGSRPSVQNVERRGEVE